MDNIYTSFCVGHYNNFKPVPVFEDMKWYVVD